MIKHLIIISSLIIICIGFCGCIERDGEIQTIQKTPSAVNINGETITLSFTDGSKLTIKEDNVIDATEMRDYLLIWIGEEIIIEYYYDPYLGDNQLKSVSPSS